MSTSTHLICNKDRVVFCAAVESMGTRNDDPEVKVYKKMIAMWAEMITEVVKEHCIASTIMIQGRSQKTISLYAAVCLEYHIRLRCKRPRHCYLK